MDGRRRGIALPMALLVLLALNVLTALALTDALQASRAAALAEDAVRARAAVVAATAGMSEPPDLAWLCLQPPSQSQDSTAAPPGVPGRLRWRWWLVAAGVVRVQVEAEGPAGARVRRVGWMRPDSLPAAGGGLGCPGAERLEPVGSDWLGAQPEG